MADTIGVLNLYFRTTGGSSRLSRQAATEVAEQASVPVRNAQVYAGVQRVTEHLREDLAGPEDLVAQATGVLMARHELDLPSARARLDDETSGGGRSLEATARGIVASIG